jgi:uncharacterized membrane protein YkoI
MKRMPKALVLSAIVLVVSFGSAHANDEALPADQVIAAIQSAVAASPGLIKEVEVEREGGRLVVQVELIGADGRETKFKVDPATNQVLR